MQQPRTFFGKITCMTFQGKYSQGQGGNVRTSSGTGGRGGAQRGGSPLMLLPLLLGGGGGGLVVVLLLLWLVFGGGFGGLGGGQSQNQAQNGGGYNLEHCNQANSSNEYDDCRAAATWGTLNEIWADLLPAQAGTNLRQPEMVIFRGDVVTGCGYATSDTGPFYCPRDTTGYLDVSFFEALGQLGGSNGPLAQSYATAHEYGHHIQQLEGTLGLSDYKNPGEDSAAVAIELQADCYAGLWAHYAEQQGMLATISDQQLNEAIQTAQAIGDDNIQTRSGGEVDPDAWTHGSSEQRATAFMAGYESGKMSQCDTLNRGVYND